MKKFATTLLGLMLALVLGFTLVACGGGDDNTDGDSVAVTGVTLNKTELTLTAGEEETLVATVAPEDATDKTVTWTSSAPEIATVTNGKVIAVSAGSATITVKTNDGAKTATCTVTVNPATGGPGPVGGTKVTKEQWVALFDALELIENATLTETTYQKMGVKYKGEYIDADTEYDNETVEMMMQMLYREMLGGVDNPYEYTRVGMTRVDLPNGIVEMGYDDAERNEYYIVDGTTIYDYYWSSYSNRYTTYQYMGYASHEQALQVLRDDIRASFDGTIVFEEFIPAGTAEEDYAESAATLAELYDEFTYDNDTDTYTIRVIHPYIDLEDGVELSIRLENGHIASVAMNLDLDMSLIDYYIMDSGDVDSEDPEFLAMAELLEGATVEAVQRETITISAIGTTTVTVPSDLEEVAAQGSVYTSYVLSDEEDYRAMFKEHLGEEGTIQLRYDEYGDGYGNYYYYLYNAGLGLLKVTVEKNNYEQGIYNRESVLYWAHDGKVSTYTAEYEDGMWGELSGWGQPVDEAYSGTAEAALLEKMPAELQLYFNFDGKPLSEQFDKFELLGYTTLAAELADGENLQLNTEYNSTTETFILYGYYAGDDMYVAVESGNLFDSYEGLPEVEGTPVTQAEWEALVNSWILGGDTGAINMAVSRYSSTAYININADRTEGVIFVIPDYADGEYKYAAFAPKDGEDGMLEITVYTRVQTSYDRETDTATYAWVVETYESPVFDNLLALAGLDEWRTAIFYLCFDVYDEGEDRMGLAEIWEYVTLNPMTKRYEFTYTVGEDEDWPYTYYFTFGEGKLGIEHYNYFDKGAVDYTKNDIPAEVVSEAVERWEIIIGTYTANGYSDGYGYHSYYDMEHSFTLEVNADMTFTITGFEETVSGTWSFDGYGFRFEVTGNPDLIYFTTSEGGATVRMDFNGDYNSYGVTNICFEK